MECVYAREFIVFCYSNLNRLSSVCSLSLNKPFHELKKMQHPLSPPKNPHISFCRVWHPSVAMWTWVCIGNQSLVQALRGICRVFSCSCLRVSLEKQISSKITSLSAGAAGRSIPNAERLSEQTLSTHLCLLILCLHMFPSTPSNSYSQ